MPEASLVVPVHNEAGLLRVNTFVLSKYLARHFSRYEIILVENGSVDDTGKVAHELKRTLDGVRVLELPEACLGEALKEGVRSAVHDKVVYFPIDLSVDLGFIPESVRLLQPLGVKVSLKLRDLLSARLDAVALVLGCAALLAGLVSLAVLTLGKVFSGSPGFVNPYSYLISMLLVTSGFQIALFGLLANLILQIRRSVEPRETVSREPDEEHSDQDN